MMKPFHTPRHFLATLVGAILLVGAQSIRVASGPRTAEVNTTGLAVTDETVTVGQLHSATGTMAISETGSVQAEQLAIEQINAMGGVLGRKIKDKDKTQGTGGNDKDKGQDKGQED